jgi:hypothetical protein
LISFYNVASVTGQDECAATIVNLLEFLCSATLTASVFPGVCADEGRLHFLSNTDTKFMDCLKMGTNPPLVSVKNNIVFMRCSADSHVL